MKILGRLAVFLLLIGGLVAVWFFWPKSPPLDFKQNLSLLQTQIQKKDLPGARLTLTSLNPVDASNWLQTLKVIYDFGQIFGEWNELDTWTEKAAQSNFLRDNRFLPFRVYALYKTGKPKLALGLAQDYKLDKTPFANMLSLLNLKANLLPGEIPLDLSPKTLDSILFGKNLVLFPEFFHRISMLTGDLVAAQNAVLMYINTGRYNMARDLAQSIKTYDNNPYFWARVYYDLGDLYTAKEKVFELNQGPGVSTESLLLHGDILMRLRIWDQAVDVFNKLINNEARSDWRAYYNQALILVLQGEIMFQTLEYGGQIPGNLNQMWDDALEFLKSGLELFSKDPDTKGRLVLLEQFILARKAGRTLGLEESWISDGLRPTANLNARMLGEDFEVQKYFFDRTSFPPAKIIPRLRQLMARSWSPEFLATKDSFPNESVAETLVWNFLLNAQPQQALQVLEKVDSSWSLLGKNDADRLKTNLKYWVPLYRGIAYTQLQEWEKALSQFNTGPLSLRDFTGTFNNGLVSVQRARVSKDQIASGHYRSAIKSFTDTFNYLPFSEDISTGRLRSLVHTQRARAFWADPPRMAGDETLYKKSLEDWKKQIESDLTEAVKLDAYNYDAFFLLRRFSSGFKNTEEQNDKTEDKRPN